MQQKNYALNDLCARMYSAHSYKNIHTSFMSVLRSTPTHLIIKNTLYAEGWKLNSLCVCACVFRWRGKPVFIKKRTGDELSDIYSVDWKTLRDPQVQRMYTCIMYFCLCIYTLVCMKNCNFWWRNFGAHCRKIHV
jgi:hypothetical protein